MALRTFRFDFSLLSALLPPSPISPISPWINLRASSVNLICSATGREILMLLWKSDWS